MNNNNMIVSESLKSGLIEYINSVINLYFNYMSTRNVNIESDTLSDNYKRLCELPKQILHVDKIEELYKYKQSVGLLEDNIESELFYKSTVYNKLCGRLVNQHDGNFYFELNGSKALVIIPHKWIKWMAPSKILWDMQRKKEEE